MSSPLTKCISLGGPGWWNILNHGDTNDYKNPATLTPGGSNGVRAYFNSASLQKVPFVTFWVDWNRAQQYNDYHPVPQTADQNLNELASFNASWISLDEQIKAANDDGKAVLIRVYHQYPAWSSNYPGDIFNPRNERNPTDVVPMGTRDRSQRFPAQTVVASPFGWFLDYVICRYKYGSPVNPAGPNQGNYFGNSTGAYIHGLMPCNEPNLTGWGRDPAEAAADMMRTASYLQAIRGTPGWVFGPDTSDLASYGPTNQQEAYDSFTRRVLSRLQGFAPSGFLGWSHHNYADCDLPLTTTTTDWWQTRASVVRSYLYGYAWKGANADRYVYLTEGGSSPSNGDPATQNLRCSNNFKLMRAMPDVLLWTNQCVRRRPTDPYYAFYDSTDVWRTWGYTFLTI